MARLTIYNKKVLKDTNEYLDNYESHNHPFPSITGLSRVLGISLSTLKRWRNDNDKQELKTTLEMIKDEQHLQLINKGIMGEFNAAICKLMLHNYGYSDKQKIETSDDKITTVVLRKDFGQPVDFDGLSDQEVIDLARKKNKNAVADYQNDYP